MNSKIGYHVRPHLTKTRFALEGLKFAICLAIPGVSVYVFRVPLLETRFSAASQQQRMGLSCQGLHAPPLAVACHPGGNPGANLKSISYRCHLFEVAFVWELTQETIVLPLGCLQGGVSCERVLVRDAPSSAQQ